LIGKLIQERDMTDIKYPGITIIGLMVLVASVDWLADVFFKVLGGVL